MYIYYSLIICVYFLLFPTNSHAYLDPISGGIILQILAAIISFFLVFIMKIKEILKYLANIFKKNKKKDKNDK